MRNVLGDIFADWPPPLRSSLFESYFDCSLSDDSPAPLISMRISWLILVLLCKLDGRAERYKDVSLSYIFLTNNLQHVVSTVQMSNLHYLLGEEWITKHEVKVKQFAANYERLAWSKVITSLPKNPVAHISPVEANPGRGPVSVYSAPASPMHFALSLAMMSTATAHTSSTSTMNDFEFSARLGLSGLGGTRSMSSANELFLNGKIRPMKLSTHLEQPQVLAPLLDLKAEEDDLDQLGGRGRD
ncbi:Exocyst complex component EXO70A1 [Morella rubra]|uniref:Exocyst subunit Exo70 family protein n=1 Tax=Morella rubra TaxID=262757 RepID=A0A6A1V8P8_9ROSI|nr:Exocyst complex component EXO70A1 [Morella rubra]